MGNCQAAETATVIIQHPSGRIQRVYWSVSAEEIMNNNPGHYVASLTVCFSDSSTPGTGVTRVKLLRPKDTLHLGRIYRLINSQDIMKELWEKYGKTKLKQRNVVEKDMKCSSSRPQSHSQREQQQEQDGKRSRSSQSAPTPRPGQWRPSLQSISEVDFPCRMEPCRVTKHKQLSYAQSATEFHAYC